MAAEELDGVMSATHTAMFPPLYDCPAHCSLSDEIACWLRRERALLTDLIASRGHPDEEIIVADLAAADHQIDALLTLGASRRWAA